MREIRYLAAAEKDLERIYYHFAVERGVASVADKVLEDIRVASTQTLYNSPNIGRPVESLVGGLRALLVSGAHWIIYTHDADAVFVRRVIAAREHKGWDTLR